MWIPLALLNTENDMTMARAFFDLLKHDEVKWHTRFDKEVRFFINMFPY